MENLDDYIIMEDENDDEDNEISDESSSGRQASTSMLREQDRFLPICNIIKIMKMTIPDNGKIAKDARECLQECVSEFISFITSEAIDKSYSENRKTVNGDDLLYAFIALGFDNYVPPLQAYLRKFRESTKCDRNIVYSTMTIHPDDLGKSEDKAGPSNSDSEETEIIYFPDQ